MSSIKVDLDKRNYDIQIANGASQTVGNWIIKEKLSTNLFIITNTKVADLYLNKFKKQFNNTFNIVEFICEDNETAKSLSVAEEIYSDLIESNFDRKSIIIALGGGVVGDLAGFVAATYLRSVPFIQVPTSLLAQVDSSVGGKVAVNHQLGKNLIGSFYQPIAVFIDPLYLKTLDKREIICGLAECIKYAYIWDKTLLDYIKNNLKRIKEINLDVIQPLIENCVTIKRDIVEIDEKENGQRALLNFGHTFAHTFETADNYKSIKHGEAVITGMICALFVSAKFHPKSINYIQEKEFLEQLFRFENNNNHKIDQFINLLIHDKKVENNLVQFILLKEIGIAYKTSLDEKTIQDSFNEVI